MSTPTEPQYQIRRAREGKAHTIAALTLLREALRDCGDPVLEDVVAMRLLDAQAAARNLEWLHSRIDALPVTVAYDISRGVAGEA